MMAFEELSATPSLWERFAVCNARKLLVFDEPHDPARSNRAAHKQGEAEGAKANHQAGFGTLRDAEDHRRKKREEHDGSKV
jgi:hypothetical protein